MKAFIETFPRKTLKLNVPSSDRYFKQRVAQAKEQNLVPAGDIQETSRTLRSGGVWSLGRWTETEGHGAQRATDNRRELALSTVSPLRESQPTPRALDKGG